MSRTRSAVVIALSLLAVACGELDPPSLVERTRVVAARVAPVDDPQIAAPSPGDLIAIDWLVVGPARPEPIAAQLVACAPLPGTANPGCRPGTLVPIAPRAPAPAPFVTELTVPPAEALAGARELLVTGAICVGGSTPALDPATGAASCEGGDDLRVELVALSIPLALDPATPANLHPTLADEPWTLEGASWDAPPDELPYDGCATGDALPSVPRVAVEPERALAITLGWSEDDRETYVTSAGDPPAPVELRETLQLSHYTSAGELERALSAVDERTEPGALIEIEWTPPPIDEVPEDGLLVVFPMVVRDGRGGVARTDRALCLTR